MGSLVFAVVANLYMEFFEELALSSAPVRSRLWKWYVDDMDCIVQKGSAEILLEHLNKIQPSIQFTLELQEDGSPSFLDTHLSRMMNGILDVTVNQKPTHTDRHLNFPISPSNPHQERACLLPALQSQESYTLPDNL